MPAFLQIDPVKVTDAGEYRCRVDFKKARTVNTVIQLKVIVPPDEPIITCPQCESTSNDRSHTKRLNGLIGPFNEGERLVLRCSTLGGKPRPTLFWWKDYTIIDDTFEYKSKDETTNDLVINSLARHHLLSVFTCQAVNNNITIAASASITIDLNLKPLEVKIKQLTPNLLAEHEAKFECSTFGSKPKAKLYWLFDGHRHDTTFQGDLQTISIVSLPVRRHHNGQILSCFAENPKIANSSSSDSLVVNVQYIPELSLQLGTSTLSLHSIQEGNDIYFDCVIDANPMPTVASLVWRFNEELLEPRQGIIQSNYSLVLQNVRRHMSGRYQCEAGNQHGTSTSNAIMLNIRYAPYCRHTATLAYGLSLYEMTELVCQVEANPMPTHFRWQFERETDLFSSQPIGNNNNNFTSIVHYRPNSTQHYGTIECTAKNDVGLQHVPCKFHVINSGPPSFPFYCQLRNQSVTQVSIRCSGQKYPLSNDVRDQHTPPPLHDQSTLSDQVQTIFVHPITYYVAEVYDKYDKMIRNLTILASTPIGTNWNGSTIVSMDHHSPSSSTASSFTFQIDSLSESNHYKIRIYSINSKGKSDQIWISAQTLRKAEKYIDGYNNVSIESASDEDSSTMFSAYSLNHIKFIMFTLGTVLIIILAIICTAITYMSRLCQQRITIKRDENDKSSFEMNESRNNDVDDEIDQMHCVHHNQPIDVIGTIEASNSSVPDTYALENLGIQTVYTETNDAICTEYYGNLLAQYSSNTTKAANCSGDDIQLLSLDMYKIEKGPPDLIPTFYFDNEQAATTTTTTTNGDIRPVASHNHPHHHNQARQIHHHHHLHHQQQHTNT